MEKVVRGCGYWQPSFADLHHSRILVGRSPAARSTMLAGCLPLPSSFHGGSGAGVHGQAHVCTLFVPGQGASLVPLSPVMATIASRVDPSACSLSQGDLVLRLALATKPSTPPPGDGRGQGLSPVHMMVLMPPVRAPLLRSNRRAAPPCRASPYPSVK